MHLLCFPQVSLQGCDLVFPVDASRLSLFHACIMTSVSHILHVDVDKAVSMQGGARRKFSDISMTLAPRT